MGGKPRPRPCFLDRMVRCGARGGEKRWRSEDGRRIYTWDSWHGEIEVFDRRGWHLGSLEAVSGRYTKGPVKGRRLDV